MLNRDGFLIYISLICLRTPVSFIFSIPTKLNDYKFFKKYSVKTPKLKSIYSESATNLKEISHSVLACT